MATGEKSSLATESDIPVADSLIAFQSISKYATEGEKLTFKKGCLPWNKGEKGLQSHSEETRRKISASLIGNTRSKGRHWSEDGLKKLSESHKGHVVTEETRRKLSDRVVTEETRKKMSEAKKGKHFSEEHKKRLSEARKEMKFSEETKRRMSEAQKGRKHTPVTKAKMSIARQGRVPWHKGRTGVYSNETLEKMSAIQKVLNNNPDVVKRASERMKGDNNPMYGKLGVESPLWRGGTSFEPYCYKFNGRLKESIRIRDGRICQLCGEKENGRRLTVHHIHYLKSDCEPDLIALCCSCHSKTGLNRDYYESMFMENLKRRGLLLSP